MRSHRVVQHHLSRPDPLASAVMALDIHRVRQAARDGSRATSNATRELNGLRNAFRNLGSGFTGDPMFRREYANLESSLKEAERAIQRVEQAVKDVERRAR